MNYRHEDIITLYDRYPGGIKNNYGNITHDKAAFHRRFDLFTQNMLRDFDYQNAVLCGGSLFTMLDATVDAADFPFNVKSDLDLFILRMGSTEQAQTKLRNVLLYFCLYAQKENLDIYFVARDMLIEVMIQTRRRIQVLLTVYDSIEECLGNMSVLHLHMYFDGELHASEAAIDNIMRRETRMCRIPIKDVKIPQLISRNVTPVGDILTTRMDPDFHRTLTFLESIKRNIDEGRPTQDVCFVDSPYVVTADANTIIVLTQHLMECKWRPQRLEYLKQLRIKQDIDVFDLNIRLPAPDILYRCAFSRASKRRRILKIKSTLTNENPAVFMERNLVLDGEWMFPSPDDSTLKMRVRTRSRSNAENESDYVHVNPVKTENILFLERYFNRQAVFRFVHNVSHVFDFDSTLYSEGRLAKGTTVDLTFVIIVYDGIDSIMYFDIVELRIKR